MQHQDGSGAWPSYIQDALFLEVKIHSDSYSFNIAESEYDNHIALSPTGVKEKGLNFKTTSVINSNTPIFNYNIYYHIMNSVSMYNIPTTKKFIKHSLRLVLPLILASWYLPYEQ
jgi:hypothetical protein